MAGPVALLRLRELTGCDNAGAVRGLEAARALLGFKAFRASVDAEDNRIAAALQTDLCLEAASAMHAAASWFIRAMPGANVGEAVTATAAPLAAIKTNLPGLLGPFAAARLHTLAADLVRRGAPEPLAHAAAALAPLAQGLNSVELAARTGSEVVAAATAYAALGDAFGLDRLIAGAEDGLAAAPYWDRIAGRRLCTELLRMQGDMAAAALTAGGADTWLARHSEKHTGLAAVLAELSHDRSWSFAKFALSTDAVREFMREAM
jgi:glutamate dehydrogenase